MFIFQLTFKMYLYFVDHNGFFLSLFIKEKVSPNSIV